MSATVTTKAKLKEAFAAMLVALGVERTPESEAALAEYIDDLAFILEEHNLAEVSGYRASALGVDEEDA